MLISNITQNNTTTLNFQKFYKVNGENHKLKSIKHIINESLPDSITFIKKKKNKHTLFILTEEHADKFLNIIPENHFRELSAKPEKFLKEKAEKLKQSNIFEKLGI